MSGDSVLEHVENDVKSINLSRKNEGLYQHSFLSSFMDCVPGYCYIEFNDYSEKNHPAFIVGIERDTNSMVLTVYKGPVQKDNVQKNHKLERKESFGKYSKDSLSLALEYYYENICGIIDV